MIALAALGACSEPRLDPTTVTGLQVVGVKATPAQPGPFDALTLEAWVADAFGHGADVLLWLCTPVEGRCLEQQPPGTTGLPLSLVTRSGQATPSFRTVTGWPTSASLVLALLGSGLDSADPLADALGQYSDDLPDDLPDDTVGLLVWALACVPGQCPIFDLVAADPVPGSPSWEEAWAALADPEALLASAAPREASVAVKFVPIWADPGRTAEYFVPNSNPLLVEVPVNPIRGKTGVSGYYEYAYYGYYGYYGYGYRPPADAAASFVWQDPDGEPVEFQAFVTGGEVSVVEPNPGLVDLHLVSTAESPAVDAQQFLVATDGRGGTAVWTNVSDEGPCVPGLEIQRAPGDQIDVLDPTVRVLATAEGGGVWRADAQIVGDDGVAWSQSTAADDGGARGCHTQSLTLRRGYAYPSPSAYCPFAGAEVEVRVTVYPPDGTPLQTSLPAIGTLPDGFDCTE